MYMDIREYKENYHRIKEIYNTVASPMDAVQQIAVEARTIHRVAHHFIPGR